MVFLSSGMHKPPVAPKPKLIQPQRPGVSPSTPRRDGLSLPSPGAQRRIKPVLAPKPCLSKLTTALESKPLALKSLHQTSVTEMPQNKGLINSQNGIQQENKKPSALAASCWAFTSSLLRLLFGLAPVSISSCFSSSSSLSCSDSRSE